MAAHVVEKKNHGGLGHWTGHGQGHPLGGVSVRPFVRFRIGNFAGHRKYGIAAFWNKVKRGKADGELLYASVGEMLTCTRTQCGEYLGPMILQKKWLRDDKRGAA